MNKKKKLKRYKFYLKSLSEKERKKIKRRQKRKERKKGREHARPENEKRNLNKK